MSVLVNKDSRVIFQGITGKAGGFHAEQCMDYGTQVVAGVTPGKGGQKFLDRVPIYERPLKKKEQTSPASSFRLPLLQTAFLRPSTPASSSSFASLKVFQSRTWPS